MLSKQQSGGITKRFARDKKCDESFAEIGYEQAEANGLGCYTTAELSASLVRDDYEFYIGDGKKYGKYLNKELEYESKYDVYVGAKVYVKVS